jgi:hypothetical protein
VSTPTPFRTEALAHRLQQKSHHRTVLSFPKQMSRVVVITLWSLLSLLVAAGGVTCMPSVPVSAAGLAIVTTDTGSDGGAPILAVLMQEEYHERLAPGNSANVLLGAMGAGLEGTVVSVEPELLSTTDVGKRLELPASALSMMQGPVSLAWVQLDGATMSDLGIDTFGRADLEVGERRAGSFLPLLGRFFEE